MVSRVQTSVKHAESLSMLLASVSSTGNGIRNVSNATNGMSATYLIGKTSFIDCITPSVSQSTIVIPFGLFDCCLILFDFYLIVI